MKIKITNNVPQKVAENIQNILNILEEIGVPLEGLTDLRLQRMAEACLAIGQITDELAEAKSVKDGIFLRTREILKFENDHYGENISPGSYDNIRRKDLKLLVMATIAINSSSITAKATNDSSRGYCLSDEFAQLLRDYGTKQWQQSIENYKRNIKSLDEQLRAKRATERIPVTLPSGFEVFLSYGEHNQLQKSIIEVFLPIFGKGCDVLYVGDTSDKLLYKDENRLSELGFFELAHDELPDVIAYSPENNILFLIEAFHSTGQWDKTRLYKIKSKLKDCTANLVFITAFETLNQFKAHSNNIAWETEVWIADIPEHMIHFNGWKFLEIH